jgi:serine/threonine-protein kinase ULK4
MDKYHIYEEIGKGEFSQVFKGREKKKIQYVAIKRVEKSMMNKVILHINTLNNRIYIYLYVIYLTDEIGCK